MLPPVLSHELREGLESFLRATYPTSTPAFRGAFDKILCETGRDTLFQGPYLRIGLPFQPGTAGRDFFATLPTGHPPYLHQEQAWERLQSNSAKSTLVATGTGSGKTECFMYPILDHVLANAGESGIKAIILYPMNALASDQARRFAEEVATNEACTGKVTVGLYVGGLDADAGSKQMTEGSVITDRDTLRSSPPDILMTNYKMLDYLLIRKDDRSLWENNGAETLKYLVVDELHSFDGAQGSDLACLIRRVKKRLKTPAKHLCCIGTSATLGGESGIASMLDFAGKIFGEPFSTDGVILETRKGYKDHIDPEENLEIRYLDPPGPEHSDKLGPADYAGIEDYIAGQIPLWFDDNVTLDVTTMKGRVELAARLREHNFLRTLLSFAKEHPVISETDFLKHLQKRRPDWSEDHLRLVYTSFVSLCAYARDEPRSGAYFLQLRSELWLRELARMVASVSPLPEVRFSADIPPDSETAHLPAIHCRDCGVMGWGAIKKTSEDVLLSNLDNFYGGFFAKNPDPRLRFIFPRSSSSLQLINQFLCGSCLAIFESKDGTCPICHVEAYDEKRENESACTIPVTIEARTKNQKNVTVADKSCPSCESSTGLTIVGSRAASLTSVALSQIFGSPFNDDKKAMAFSDSVQDASHRAGFFTGRTYPIAVRTALAQHIAKQEGQTSLAELSRSFAATARHNLGDVDFVGRFIPPTMEHREDYEILKRGEGLGPRSTLAKDIEARLSFEVYREFGLQARIGRTLEKSGSAAATIDPDKLKAAAEALLQKIHDLGESFHSVAPEDLAKLIRGLNERLRSNGGIYHPLLEVYLESEGNAYTFNRQEHLPRIKKTGTGRRPTFFATFPIKDTFERIISSGNASTWTETYVAKFFRSRIGPAGETLDPRNLIELIFEEICQQGIWGKREIDREKGRWAFGIQADSLIVSSGATGMGCQECGHQISVATSEQTLWESTPCLRLTCPGEYGGGQLHGSSFFGDLYRKGDVARLRAAEHTGLLNREAREDIEREFMRKEQLSTDTTLLSCTPTLEMGVDVGDLSSVLLCSVPPAQANYLQRVGRGGRRDGNSLALTIANAEEHDLSYFEEPLKMLAGDVEMPSIFLNAPAVLERQMTAYCIDRWVEESPKAEIPRKMAFIYAGLGNEDKEKQGGVFPQALYDFIEPRQVELTEGFLSMFPDDELKLDSEAYLEHFIQGNESESGSLAYKLNHAFLVGYQEVSRLEEDRRKLTTRLAKLSRKQPQDEKTESEVLDTKRRRGAVSRLVKSIKDKQTLNFLTDEGLLPNYAFPEEGVTLHSLILRKTINEDDDGKSLEKLEFEYLRPAESAIKELAPGNSFYVQGRKLTVDRIAVDQEDFETWHFCKSCSHVEPIGPTSAKHVACPKCQCTGWQDQSLTHQLLKMRQVFVTAWDTNTRSLDQRDQRELATFNNQTDIGFEPDAISRSFRLKAEGVGFAFDFLKRITLRGVNLGKEKLDADALQIGGNQVRGVGFTVCRKCGKVQGTTTREKDNHDVSCPHYGSTISEEETTSFLLYRELNSEAIRLLIPSLSEDDDIDTQSFVAAIHLGLRRKFGGHLSHLRLEVQSIPLGDSNLRSQHVFIYDSVPGGTGYLKDLMRAPESLLDIIKAGHEALTNCSCAGNSDIDGCYQCIRAYRFRYVNSQISREVALRQFGLILDNQESIEEQSSDEALLNPLLESELEKRFINRLMNVEGFRMKLSVISGKPAYILTLGPKASWKVIPQVTLGKTQGVQRNCRPDFLMQPLRPSQGRPIAVFLDGFAFHASEEHNRIADDLAKRNAILRSENYRVWSLTWDDLNKDDSLDFQFLKASGPLADAMLNEFTPDGIPAHFWKNTSISNWELFTRFLTSYQESNNESDARWKKTASFVACCHPAIQRTDLASIEKGLNDLSKGSYSRLDEIPENPSHIAFHRESPHLKIVSAIPMADIAQKDFSQTLAALWFDDSGNKPKKEFSTEWRQMLTAINILQFIPRLAAFTKEMNTQGLVTDEVDWLLYHESKSASSELGHSLNEDEMEELQMIDPDVLVKIVDLLKSSQLPFPEIGYEFAGTDGLIGTCLVEVAWPEKKIALVVSEVDRAKIEASGWTVFTPDQIESERLLTLF